MRLVTWNINSVRLRIGRLTALLQRHQPDVVCLQEIKTEEQHFPLQELIDVGYNAEVSGQKGYNGVALIYRADADIGRVQAGFPGDPTPQEARVISAEIDGVRVINVYVVNGKSPHSESFAVKLQWLDQLRRWVREVFRPQDPLIIAGDFNITPGDLDVHDPSFWKGRLLCTDDERGRLRALHEWGLVDLLRARHERAQLFSWWDYRYGAFKRNQGLRIDLVLGTAPIVDRLIDVSVDRDERDPDSGEGKPSDHAPVIVDLAATPG